MELTSACLVLGAALLTIEPNRPQFFLFESFNLTCGVRGGGGAGWTVLRNASQPFFPCERWGKRNGSSCINRIAYMSDSGRYWCQSQSGECSNGLDITVTTGVVILEIPALPVTAGGKVTLTCSHKESSDPKSSSNFSAKFYRNGTFIGQQPHGNLTFTNVSKENEGLYRCEHPTAGQSPESWLAVEGSLTYTAGETPAGMSLPRVLSTALLVLLYLFIMLLCISVHREWARARAEKKKRDLNQI